VLNIPFLYWTGFRGNGVPTWSELLEEEDKPISFLLHPYIASHSITLLHARKGQGKSPLTWNWGLSIASGKDWCGLPTQRGRVLYIEVDTPRVVVKPRLRFLEAEYPRDIPFRIEFLEGGIDILNPRASLLRDMKTWAAEEPDLVIVNTLRKVFAASANDSEVPSRVYGAFQHIFPTSALLFVHHDRKRPREGEGDRETEGEDLSGSLAWKNDAQVSLHLRKWGKKPGVVVLDHTGSQASELHPPLILRVGEDGSHVSPLREESLSEVRRILALVPPGTGAREMDRMVAEALGCSERTARTLRAGLMVGSPSKNKDVPLLTYEQVKST